MTAPRPEVVAWIEANRFKRFGVARTFPKPPGPRLCRWCGEPCTGRRRTWCSDECNGEFMVRVFSNSARLRVEERPDEAIAATRPGNGDPATLVKALEALVAEERERRSARESLALLFFCLHEVFFGTPSAKFEHFPSRLVGLGAEASSDSAARPWASRPESATVDRGP